MKKEYKYVPPPSPESDTADEYGITESMLDFSWDRDVEMSVSCDNSYRNVFFMMYVFVYS